MPFIKPPFLQWSVKPVASRGLGDPSEPPPEEVFVQPISNVLTLGRPSIVWYDVTLPPEYVAGTDMYLTVNCDNSGDSGTNLISASGTQVIPPGGGIIGDDLDHIAYIIDAFGIAAAPPNSVIIPYVSSPADGRKAVPVTRNDLIFRVPGLNRSIDAAWDGISPLLGSGIVFASTGAVPPAQPAGFPFYQNLPAGFTSPQLVGSFVPTLDTYCAGGVNNSAGPFAVGAHGMLPGQRFSLVLALMPTMQLANIFSLVLNCGAGGLIPLRLNTGRVITGLSAPPGQSRNINTSSVGGNNTNPWRVRTLIGLYPYICTVAPVISGNAYVGDILNVMSNGTWAVAPAPPGFAYQWLRNNLPIPGAISNTYLLTTADLNKQMSCRITPTGGNGGFIMDSNIIGPINPKPVTYNRITGDGDYRVTGDSDPRIVII